MITVPMKVTATQVTVPMDVSSSLVTVPVSLGTAYEMAGVADYDGAYEVIPRMYMQTLETTNKRMRDDVTVHEIPVTRTSNPEGGLTVLIG